MIATAEIFKKNKLNSLGARIFMPISIIVAGLFLIMFIFFNIFVNMFINNDITDTIEKASFNVLNKSFTIPFQGKNQIIYKVPQDPVMYALFYRAFYSEVVKSLQAVSKFNNVNAVLFTDDFNRIYPDDNNTLLLNIEEMDDLIYILKERELVPGKISEINTNNGKYYYKTINLKSIYELDNCNLLFFVNTSRYDILKHNINFALINLLCVALFMIFLCTIIISRSISKPINKLCNFADDIGKGKFERQDFNFPGNELMTLNTRMNETAYKLELYDKDQKTFFQNVSHEMRTPLMSIKGYAEGMKYGIFENTNDRDNASDIIISEADRLGRLVEDLLFISRIDSNQIILNKLNVNLVELVGNCIEKLKGLIVGKNKEIVFNFNVDEILYKCDEGSLSRAVMNIISNAIRYSVKLINVDVEKNENEIIIKIADDGAGIKKVDLPNIFNRFYKGTDGKHGIGLSITKSVIDQHGGTVSVHNRENKGETGAVFVITL